MEIKVFIDGKEVTGNKGDTVLELARKAGAEIPTLCHDERTKPYGSCGLCVVEEEGKPRLLRACSTVAADGMKILTNTEKVGRTRRTALELLLSDHTGDCRPPCALACPADTDCQGYVGLIANGEFEAAARLIREKLPLPSSIGRVCPHPCEDECRRKLVEEPVSIANLKYFVTDKYSDGTIMTRPEPDSGKKVAVVGGGPGGLSVAYFLRLKGHSVTVYDQMPEMGGMLRYGIPEYRLPRNVLASEVRIIEKMGVVMRNNVKIGKDVDFDVIKNGADAVVLAIGAWKSSGIGCPGEDNPGVLGGIDFLRSAANHIAPRLEGKKAAVVGAGNTAMDACRTAVRLGAEEVFNIYRRTKAEMPANPDEIREAEEEGVIFLNLANPIEIKRADERLLVRLQKMELGEPDQSGRRAPVPIPGAEEEILVDYVIAAIGQAVDAAGFETAKLTRKGTIEADELTYMTGVPGLFAIGDAANKGPGIAVSAVGAAQKAAEAINIYLKYNLGGEKSFLEQYAKQKRKPELVKQKLAEKDFEDREKIQRIPMPHLPPEERKHSFNEVNHGFSEEQARKEASRCLECGCHDYFECKLINYTNQYGAKVDKYDGVKHKSRIDVDEHPFIARNVDKCILCGLCVRVCDEAMDVGALGFAGRGFDTQAIPALGKQLESTSCVSCGQCVSACPTGALIEKAVGRKPVPVEETQISTVCPGCGVGCSVKAAVNGGSLLRVLPDLENDPGVLLCRRGRFEIAANNGCRRLDTPITGKRRVSFDAAYDAAKDAVSKIVKAYGADAVAVSVSPSLTSEELAAAVKLAESIGTKNIFTFADISDISAGELLKARLANREGEAANGLYPNACGVAELKLSGAGKEIKALIALGETPEINAEGLEFLLMTVTHDDGIAPEADIVFPLPAAYETDGTVTGADGKTRRLKAVLTPPSKVTALEIINSLK